jgi:hypothetical protein
MAIKHEEMLIILGHKGNANQNHIKIPPHPSQNGDHGEHKQCGEKKTSTLLVGM